LSYTNQMNMGTTESKIIELPLLGVASEHCALIVDKGLAKVPGVTSHKVELNNQKAIITAKDTAAIPQAVFAGNRNDLRIVCDKYRKHDQGAAGCGERQCNLC
jgi:copper chaperone CopZ